MCTFTAQVAALPPRASRPYPVWPTGAGLSAFLSCAHPPPLSGGTCCGAVPHCAAPANRRLLFSTLLLPRWCADSAFDNDGVYTMDLLPDFQHGIPAPLALPHTSLHPSLLLFSAYHAVWLTPCLCMVGCLFFLVLFEQTLLFSLFNSSDNVHVIFLQLPLVLSEIIYLCMYYI